LEEAERLGFVTQNGVDMLLYQALVADHLYLEREIDYAAMVQVVRETLAEEAAGALAP
jgi:shikimate 5-dehydrogenase